MRAEKKQSENMPPSEYRLRYRRSILLACISAAMLAVSANFFAAQLPARLTRYDTTDVALYSISEYTEQIAQTLDRDVEIYLVAQHGREDMVVQELLERYAELSRHIRVGTIDPVLRPDLAEQYAPSMENNSVVVVCGDRFHVIASSEMYVESQTYTQGAGYTYEAYFNGEQEITSAVISVTNGEAGSIYCLTGHGESVLSEDMIRGLEQENLEVRTISLAVSDMIPSDADAVLLYAPQRDISEAEAEALLAYMKSGGRLLLIGGCLGDDAPNLDAVTGYYGAECIEGTVMERESGYYISQYPTYVLAGIADHEITKPFAGKGYFVLMPLGHGLVPMDDVRETVISKPLLYTSSSSLSISGDSVDENTQALALGPFTLGLAVEEEVSAGKSRLVWLTSSYMLLDEVNVLSSGTNRDFFLNCVSWLCDSEQGISVRNRDLMMQYLSISPSAAMQIGAVIAILLPAAVLCIGGAVIYRRRMR